VPTADLIDRLAEHHTVGHAPREQLQWLALHGSVRAYASGETISSSAQEVDELYVVLSGHITIRLDRGNGSRTLVEWRAGEVTGLLPYSRLTAPPADVVAEQPTEILKLHRRDFPALIRDCGELTSILVHVMLDRARFFTSSELHDEKMASLGRLAAGLAHELNNPAAAAARSASSLAASLVEATDAARALGAAQASEAQRAAIDRLRSDGLAPAATLPSPLDRADRYDAVAEWLAGHGLDEHLGSMLADSPLSLEALDELAGLLGGELLPAALAFLATESQARRLAAEIETAASRIHALVSATKRFSYMDRAPALAAVDVREGLADTLTMLHTKARARSVEITLDAAANLPPVDAFGGELNQIWTNLIENAIDAVGEGGHVAISAREEGPRVVVRVVDDGPGIPAAIRDRIFDPFFTTKPVGQGTGLGLEIVRRLAARHGAWLEVDSAPGRTEFRVALPVHGAGAAR
jgi:signal transduction histidine kinase